MVSNIHELIIQQKITNGCLGVAPYLCTIIIDLAIAGYMLFRPSEWVASVMELTFMSDGFRSWVVALALGAFALALLAETIAFPHLARIIGHIRARLRPNYRKKRRQYKILLEQMRL
jgi:cation-transporting ATPase 13A3/4/5